MLSEVVTCNCVRNPRGHAESHPRPSEEGVSFYHNLRPLDQHVSESPCRYLPVLSAVLLDLELWCGRFFSVG